MRKILSKGIIYLLVFAITINSFPIYVLAGFFAETKVSELEGLTDDKGNDKEVTIIGEIEEKRTLNEKHYLMSDGTITAAVYPDNVHYEKDGKYVDIDNTLVATNNGYTLKNNDLKLEFFDSQEGLKKDISNNTLSISNEGYTLNWGIKDFNIEKSVITKDKTFDILEYFNKAEIFSNDEKNSMEVTNTKSGLTYKGAIKNIDIKYDIISDKVEESIIINNKEGLRDEFAYNIEVDGLTIKQVKNNELILVDSEDNIIFYIDAPYMYDAENEYSDSIKLIPTKTNSGYSIKMELDKEWLNSNDRVYPIVVDPIITTKKETSAIKDTYIYNGDAGNTTKGTAHILRAGNTNAPSSSARPFRTLIQFTLPELKSGDQVIAADLNIYSYDFSGSTTAPTRTFQLDIHQVTAAWSETAVYWSTMNTKYNSEIIDYIKYQWTSSNKTKGYAADITKAVKEWYNTGNNYGIMIKEHAEANNNSQADAHFISVNTSSAYYQARPYIVIQYRNQTGLEGYLTTHTQSIGRTTTFTNDYNGNLTLIHNDASTPGSKLPVSVYHVYNANDRGLNFGYGNGYRLNFSQTIEANKINNVDYLKYTDEDGTIHYFKKNGTIWEDEDGLSFEIIATSATVYTMNAGDGRQFIFTKMGVIWFLTNIIDSDENTITITRNTTTPQLINNIKDGGNDVISFIYSNGLLTKVIDPSNREISYTYTGSNLTNITYPDGESTSFIYNTNNLITRITNIDGSYRTYSYYGVSPYRVNKTKEYSSNGIGGNGYTINYGANTTTFTDDNSGEKVTYSFDNWGHTLSISDFGENNSVSGAYGSSYEYGISGSNTNELLGSIPFKKSINNYIINSSAESDLTNWNISQWGTNQGVITVNNTISYLGSKSFKISTSTATNIQPILWQHTPMVANGTYTLSAYIKGNIANNLDDDKGAFFFIEYANANGVYTHEYFKINNITGDWDRYSTTFKMPSDTTSAFKIGIVIKNAQGDIYIDNIQLEEGSVANNYNLIENGNFIKGETRWGSKTNLVAADQVVTIDGVKAFRITGELKTKNLAQYIELSGDKGDSFLVNYWAKNTGSPSNTSKQARMVFEFLDAAGTVIQKEEIHVSSDSKNWQYISDQIVAKENYKRIKVTPTFNQNTSNIYYTNIGVYRDDEVYVSPDIVEVEEHPEDDLYIEVATEYSEGEKYQTKEIDELGKALTYTYNENRGTIANITDANGNIINYTYDIMDRLITMSSGNNAVSYTYNKDKLSAINHNGFSYNFLYDDFSNITNAKVGNINLVTNTYGINNDFLTKTTYGNGHEINYNYDQFGRLSSKGNADKTTNYTYDNNGNISKKNYNNNELNYTYDLNNRISSFKYNNDYKINYIYTNSGSIGNIQYRLGNINKIKNYTYNQYGKIHLLNEFNYEYDSLSRLETKKITNNYTISYNYLNIDNEKTTNTIESINNNGNILKYEYDNVGNITRVLKNNTEIEKYYYGSLNQLVKEDNLFMNKTIVYNYDYSGNILSKKEYQYKTTTLISTKSYSYGNNNWKDQLTNFNGENITYDSIGNPLTIGSNISFTWKNGRELNSYSDTSKNTNISYLYDDQGIRTSKIVNGVKTNYYLEGLNIIYEERNGQVIYYMYDDSGIVGFEYQNNKYYYVKNIQGDIIEIVDSGFNVVGSYTYDAWGNVINVTGTNITLNSNSGGISLFGYCMNCPDPEPVQTINIAELNPFRYRGYYYDTESGLYYLNSRYYNPEMGRFINADAIEVIVSSIENPLGANLYTYVHNNPINNFDPTGYKIVDTKKIVKWFFNTKLGKKINKETANGNHKTIFKLLGFDIDKDGIYHARFNCWQMMLGYNNLYDFAFNLGTDMLKEKFIFVYSGKDYVFWVWKGDYLNLGAGAELGIYERVTLLNGLIKTEQWRINTKLALRMTIKLIDNKGRVIVPTYTARHWWITGFNPDPKYQNMKAKNLRAMFIVDFNGNTNQKNMYNALRSRHQRDLRWNFDSMPYKAMLTF